MDGRRSMVNRMRVVEFREEYVYIFLRMVFEIQDSRLMMQ